MLAEVLTHEAFAHMTGLAESLAQRSRAVIAEHRLPWCVAQLGSRMETMFAPVAPRNAAEFRRSRDDALEALLHVYFMNRGVLITPFHCMLLMCPATTAEDTDRYLAVLRGFCAELVANRGAAA